MSLLPPSTHPVASTCTNITAYNDLETIKYKFSLTFDKFNNRAYESYGTNEFAINAKSNPKFRFELCFGAPHVNLYIKFLSMTSRFIFHYKVGAVDKKGHRCDIDETQGCRSITEIYNNKSVQLFTFDKCSKLNNGQSISLCKQITFHCELTFETEYNIDRIMLITTESHEIRQLSADLSDLLTTGRNADITFSIGARELPAHKAVLTARSPVFAAMFEHECRERQQARIEIIDIEEEIFEQLLQFIYSGRISRMVDLDKTTKILAAADKYQLLSLKSICENFLCTQISSSTVHSLIVVADLYGAAKLASEAMEFFKRNTHQAIESIFANNRTDALLEAFRILAISNAKEK